MKSTIEKLSDNLVALEIEVEAEVVKQACEEAYKKMKTTVNIPGFRKGKVPKNVIEQKYGKEVFLHEAMEDLVSEFYAQAVVEHEVDYIDRPDVEIQEVSAEGPLKFKAIVEIAPPVELGEYKGVEVKKPAVEFDPAMVEKQIDTFREKNAELAPSESDTAKDGDFAIFDFDGSVDGEPIEGGKAEGYTLQLGSGQFIPGFEEQMIGMKIGEEKEIKTTFPEEYHSPDLAGKDAVFKIKLHELKAKQMPEADDEFAKKVSKFETMAEFRAHIEQEIKDNVAKEYEKELRTTSLQAAIDNAKIEVPQKMVTARTSKMLEDFKQSIGQQGLQYEKYLELVGKTEDEIREDMNPQALNAVKADLVMKEIAKKENLMVTNEEMDEEIDKLSKEYGHDAEKIKAYMFMQGTVLEYKQALVFDKTLRFVADNAKLVD